jgi:hypothetical protein
MLVIETPHLVSMQDSGPTAEPGQTRNCQCFDEAAIRRRRNFDWPVHSMTPTLHGHAIAIPTCPRIDRLQGVQKETDIFVP